MNDGSLTFTGEQVERLREMIEEWICEGFTTPPYTSVTYDIFEALGLDRGPTPWGSYDTRRDRVNAAD